MQDDPGGARREQHSNDRNGDCHVITQTLPTSSHAPTGEQELTDTTVTLPRNSSEPARVLVLGCGVPPTVPGPVTA